MKDACTKQAAENLAAATVAMPSDAMQRVQAYELAASDAASSMMALTYPLCIPYMVDDGRFEFRDGRIYTTTCAGDNWDTRTQHDSWHGTATASSWASTSSVGGSSRLPSSRAGEAYEGIPYRD